MGAWTPAAKSAMFAIAVTGAPRPSLYLALYSNSANPAGTPVELALAGYARQLCTLVLSSTDSATSAYDMVFGPLAMGSYIGVSLLDASTGGTVWFWDDELAAIPIPASSTVTFAAGLVQAVRSP